MSEPGLVDPPSGALRALGGFAAGFGTNRRLRAAEAGFASPGGSSWRWGLRGINLSSEPVPGMNRAALAVID